MSYSDKVQGILDTIGGMTVRELVELKEAFKAEFKVEAAAPVMMAGGPAAGGAAPAAEEKTTFDVILAGGGQNKIAVIKVVPNSRASASRKPRTSSTALRSR